MQPKMNKICLVAFVFLAQALIVAPSRGLRENEKSLPINDKTVGCWVILINHSVHVCQKSIFSLGGHVVQ